MSGAGATQGGSVQRSTIPKVEIGEAPPPTGPYWQRMPNNHKMDPSSTYMSYGLAADDKDPTHDNLYKYIQPESVNSTISYDMK